MAEIINSAEQLGAITNGVVGDFLLNVDTINTSVFIGGTFDANGTRVYADDAADRSTVTIGSYSGNSVTVNDVELRINNADITLNSDMTIGDNANWLYLRKSILNLNGKTLTLDKCKLLSTGLEISGLGTVNIIANDSPCWQTFANIISNGAVVNTNMPLNVYEDLTVLSGGTLCNIGRSGNGVIHIGFDDSFWTDGAVMTVSGAGSLLISQGVAIGAVIHGADAAQGIEESKLIVADGGRVDLVAAGTTNNLGIIDVSGGTLAHGTLNNSGEMSITDGVLTITGKWSNVAGSSDVNVTNSTLKINKLDNDVALFLNGENTFQVEDASGSSFAVRVNDGVVFNNSYMKSSNNETLRLLGSATFNGGFAGAYLQGSSGGVGGTVTIDGLVDMSYGVEFSNNYTLNGGKIKLSGGNADGNVWGCVFQNATFTINTDIEVNGGTSAAPIHFTNATATINSTITHHYSGGEVIYIGGDNGSTVTLGETGCINGTVFIYSLSKLTVAGGTINAASLNNAGTITVDYASTIAFGALTNSGTITIDTTGYTDGEYLVFDYTGTGSKDMAFYESILGKLDHSFTVKDGDLYYRANNEVHADIYDGSGSTLMTGGAVNTFFADKSGADEIATTIHGGKIENHLVAGAYVAAGNTAAVSNVELNIDNAAEVAGKVYAGGYLYGDGNASAEAQLKVTEVNVTINGGEVTTNMYGGAHAREYGNAKVDTVNMTVTGGIHSRIYAGGWAEKGAQSHVGIANITVSGGSVDYLYGAGANADGETFVGTSNITIEGDAEVNTIFMGGRYGYSYVDIVNLTFDGDDKVLNRLSGVSSAGMDYADATNVELKTNVTADLIDYVDKFVINEDCTLTANNEFVLGNRIEGGAEPGVTTFDFVTDGLDKAWTAVAGISDFANAKFSVNGAGLTAWNGTAAIEIGGYELTYDAEKKTITLANA